MFKKIDFTLIYYLGCLVILTIASDASANESPSVEINYETLNALSNQQQEIPPINNAIQSYKTTLTAPEGMSQSAQLQNIEPAAGRTAQKLAPLPSKKPFIEKVLAPVPERPPVRGNTPKKVAIIKNLGKKPDSLEDKNTKTSPAPVAQVASESLASETPEMEIQQEELVAALDPSLVKSTIEEKAEIIQPKTSQKSNERTRAGSIQRIFLSYPQGQTDLPANIESALSPDIIAEIGQREDKRLSIYAYATSAEENKSEARRIALARALGLREFLIAQSIDPKRIDLHPMGITDEPLKKDRVEISLEDVSTGSP